MAGDAAQTDAVRASFVQAFGRQPAVIASAPGRVNLIGEHTDYNGGDVLPIGIELRTSVAMARARRSASTAVSSHQREPAIFSIDLGARSGHWWDYVAGPLFVLRTLGVDVPNVSVAVASDVPPGAGLSSSAALELATVVAASTLCRTGLDLETLARAAHRAENDVVGVPSGIMDQFASALARRDHALLLSCDTERVEHVPFQESVLVFDTAAPRRLLASAYATRRDECAEALRMIRERFPEVRFLARASGDQVRETGLSSPLAERATHVVEETVRVSRAVGALRAGGRIPSEVLFESHASLRALFDCSTPELDWFVAEAEREGAMGARLTGAGWGGCALALGTPDMLAAFAVDVAHAYRARFAREPRSWLVQAAAGAVVDCQGPSQ